MVVDGRGLVWVLVGPQRKEHAIHRSREGLDFSASTSKAPLRGSRKIVGLFVRSSLEIF